MCSLLKQDIYLSSFDLSFVWQSIASTSSSSSTNTNSSSAAGEFLSTNSSSGKEKDSKKKKSGLKNFFALSPTPTASSSAANTEPASSLYPPGTPAASIETWNVCKQAMNILHTALQDCQNEYLLHVHVLGDADFDQGVSHEEKYQRSERIMRSIGEALAKSRMRGEGERVHVDIEILGSSHPKKNKRLPRSIATTDVKPLDSVIRSSVVRFTCTHYEEPSDYYTKQVHNHLVMIHYYNQLASSELDRTKESTLYDVNILNTLNFPHSVYLIVLHTTGSTKIDEENKEQSTELDATTPSTIASRQFLSSEDIQSRYKYWLNYLHSVVDREDIMLPPLSAQSATGPNTYAGPTTSHNVNPGSPSIGSVSQANVNIDNLQSEHTEYNLNQQKDRYHSNKRRQHRSKRSGGSGSGGNTSGTISSIGGQLGGDGIRRRRKNGLRAQYPYRLIQGIPIMTVLDISGMINHKVANDSLDGQEVDSEYLELLQLTLAKQLQSLYCISHLPSHRSCDFLVPYDVIYLANMRNVQELTHVMRAMSDISDEYAGIAGAVTSTPMLKHLSQSLLTLMRDRLTNSPNQKKALVLTDSEWRHWLRELISSYFHFLAVSLLSNSSMSSSASAAASGITPAVAKFVLALDEELDALANSANIEEVASQEAVESDLSSHSDSISKDSTKKILISIGASVSSKKIGKLSKEQRDDLIEIMMDYCVTYLIDTKQIFLVNDCDVVLNSAIVSNDGRNGKSVSNIGKSWKKSVILNYCAFFTACSDSNCSTILAMSERGSGLVYYDNQDIESSTPPSTQSAMQTIDTLPGSHITTIEHEVGRYYELIDFPLRNQLISGFFEQISWPLLYLHGFSCKDSSSVNHRHSINLIKRCRYPFGQTPTLIKKGSFVGEKEKEKHEKENSLYIEVVLEQVVEAVDGVDVRGGVVVKVQIIHNYQPMLESTPSPAPPAPAAATNNAPSNALLLEQKKKEREKEKERERIWRSHVVENAFETINTIRQTILKDECFGLRFREHCLALTSMRAESSNRSSVSIEKLMRGSHPMEEVMFKLFGVPILDHNYDIEEDEDETDDSKGIVGENHIDGTQDDEKRDRSHSMGTSAGGCESTKSSKSMTSAMKIVQSGDHEVCIASRQSVLSLYFGDIPDNSSSTTTSSLEKYSGYESLVIPLSPLDLPLRHALAFSSRMNPNVISQSTTNLTPLSGNSNQSSYSSYYEVERERHRDFLVNFLLKHCHSREEFLKRITHYHQSKKRIRLTIEDEACMRDFLLRLVYLYSISPNANDYERDVDHDGSHGNGSGWGNSDEDDEEEDEEIGISLQEFDAFITTHSNVWIRKPLSPGPMVGTSAGNTPGVPSSNKKAIAPPTVTVGMTTRKVSSKSVISATSVSTTASTTMSNIATTASQPAATVPSLSTVGSVSASGTSVDASLPLPPPSQSTEPEDEPSKPIRPTPTIEEVVHVTSSLDSLTGIRDAIEETRIVSPINDAEPTTPNNTLPHSNIPEEGNDLRTVHEDGEGECVSGKSGRSNKSGRSDKSHRSAHTVSSHGGEGEGGEGVQWTPFVGSLVHSKSSNNADEDDDNNEDDQEEDTTAEGSIAAIASVVTMSMARIRMRLHPRKSSNK